MKSEKFLQFNGRNIFFQNINGEFYIAVKPICEALNIEYSRQLRTLKSDDILKDVWSLETMHDTTNRLQKMVSIPEKYIYGWIFSLQSQSKELKDYKRKCYDILFNYFHGTITGRKELLTQKIELDIELMQAENELLQNEAYLKIQKIKKKQSEINKGLKNNDLKVIEEQKNLFNYS